MFYQVWNDIATVFLVFITNPFTWNQVSSCCINLFIFWFRMSSFVAFIWMFVSSANRTIFAPFILIGRSFMYNKNKIGLWTDHWGTPCFISFKSEVYLPDTCFVLSWYCNASQKKKMMLDWNTFPKLIASSANAFNTHSNAMTH